MHRPRQYSNIPTEIIRTVVAIAETGSLSKAGERLGLSQPAISSQVKRLQSLVGRALFVRTANGTTTTELGKVAVQQARRILEANDQLLRLGGANGGSQLLRLGISTLLAEEFPQAAAGRRARRYPGSRRHVARHHQGADRRLHRYCPRLCQPVT
ncbi:LysR family transcriptional regulator [Bradyrhizobium sp. ISRA435]|nr:LysR family transcriptional regulator [Bradyrhizobium sp. ISRA435]